MEKPKISINILNYNTYDLTCRCIDSCLRQTGIRFEIVLIDNNSTDDSFLKLKDHYGDDINYLQNTENFGYAKGNNLGVQYCYKKGVKYSFLLNSDIELRTSNVLNKLIQIMDKYKNCGIVAPEVFNITSKGNILNINESSYLKLLRFFRVLPTIGNGKDEVVKVSIAHGSALLVRNEEFLKVNGFPEYYFMYGEENNLEKKILWDGYDILWLRDSTNCVYHYHDTSIKQSDWRIYLSGRNFAIEYCEYKKKLGINWFIAFYLCILIQKIKKNYNFVKGAKHGIELYKKKLSHLEMYNDGKKIREVMSVNHCINL